ncbi:MAG TPA: DoxX family protein [Burkholderiales bacterium]|nr:DoxX family protein [Burkholderiales bacterium]
MKNACAAMSKLKALEGPRHILADLLDLGIRLYVAKIFFMAGLTKIRDWDSTLFLFQEEYAVPLLPPQLAAILGTFGELVFPVLLALGLAARLGALGLSVVNLMAVVSYWSFLQNAEAALFQHVMWGVLLLVTLLHGPGRISVDALICKRCMPRST